jgi:hypothetical protein
MYLEACCFKFIDFFDRHNVPMLKTPENVPKQKIKRDLNT